MKNKKPGKLSSIFSTAGLWTSFSFIAMVIFSAIGCSKDKPPIGLWLPSGSESKERNTDIYFSINFKGSHISYGQIKNTFLPPDLPQPASLKAITKMDSTGELITEITISVEALVQHSFSNDFNNLGDVQAHFQMVRKGSSLTGLYTNLSRDSVYGVNGIYAYDIAISNQGGYVIDTSGLEFNIKKEGTSTSTGDYVEGDFQFNLLYQVGLTDKTHATGTFKLYKY